MYRVGQKLRHFQFVLSVQLFTLNKWFFINIFEGVRGKKNYNTTFMPLLNTNCKLAHVSLYKIYNSFS